MVSGFDLIFLGIGCVGFGVGVDFNEFADSTSCFYDRICE